jgi:hypothetical protein
MNQYIKLMNQYTPYKIRKNITDHLISNKWKDYIDLYDISDNNKIMFATYLEKHSKWDQTNDDGRNTISTSSMILSKVEMSLFNVYFVTDIEETEHIFNSQDKFTAIENMIIDNISSEINSIGIDRKIESIHSNSEKPNLYIDILVARIDFEVDDDVREMFNDRIKVKTKYKIS